VVSTYRVQGAKTANTRKEPCGDSRPRLSSRAKLDSLFPCSSHSVAASPISGVLREKANPRKAAKIEKDLEADLQLRNGSAAAAEVEAKQK
jgi:hypothetical protein